MNFHSQEVSVHNLDICDGAFEIAPGASRIVVVVMTLYFLNLIY